MTSVRKRGTVHRSLKEVALAGRYFLQKTNLVEVERILRMDLQKLIGRLARIKDKNRKGVDNG